MDLGSSYIREYWETHNWGPYLEKHHQSYLAIAWMGYQQMGRGFVVLDFTRAVMDTNGNIVEMPVEYLTADELIAKQGGHPLIIQDAHKVANHYDPEAEMAVCHIYPSAVLLGTNGTFPIRQIYEEVTAR